MLAQKQHIKYQALQIRHKEEQEVLKVSEK